MARTYRAIPRVLRLALLPLALLLVLLVLLTASSWQRGRGATTERPFQGEIKLISPWPFCSKCCAGHYGHHGEDLLCCGQEGNGGNLYNLSKVCPRHAPACRGFKQGIQYGDCFPLGEGSEAELVAVEDLIVRSISRAAVLASADCRPCPTSCCDRPQSSSTSEHGDCETHGRFRSGCCRKGPSSPDTLLTCDSASSRHPLKDPQLPGRQCDLSAGDINCTACRCDCDPWRLQPERDRMHAGRLAQCLNGPHHRPNVTAKHPCDPTGIRISDDGRVKATLQAESCDWDVTEPRCSGRGLAVPLSFVFDGDETPNGDETAYRKQGYECFCNAGWRGSRCQLLANGAASRLTRCMADANKTLLLWIGDSQTRSRYVAFNKLFRGRRGGAERGHFTVDLMERSRRGAGHEFIFAPFVDLTERRFHRGSVGGGLTLKYEFLGTPFVHRMPAEHGRMGEHDAMNTVTVFNSHLWQAAMNRSQYCDLMRRTERTLLKRDTYGLRLFVGIEPVNHARLDHGRNSTWQNNSVFRSEEDCVNGLFDGYVPMWDTIKDLSADKQMDGFHHTYEVADAQVLLIIDAVCAALGAEER